MSKPLKNTKPSAVKPAPAKPGAKSAGPSKPEKKSGEKPANQSHRAVHETD